MSSLTQLACCYDWNKIKHKTLIINVVVSKLNTGKNVFASEHVIQYRNTKVIIQSQTWGMSLTGSVSGAAFQLCLYFVSIKKMTEGVKLKVAVIQAWLSIIQCWPCLLRYAYILPPGSCLVHTVPLAAVQQLHMISYQAHVYSFFSLRLQPS